MFRAEIVWVVLAVHAFAVVVCPAETVLCRTFDGCVKVETALNGACSKQLHDSPGTPRPVGGDAVSCSCAATGRHGPCYDTLLTADDDATYPHLLPVPVDDAVKVAADPDHGLAAECVVLAESTDPPWQQFDLRMLRRVRLLV